MKLTAVMLSATNRIVIFAVTAIVGMLLITLTYATGVNALAVPAAPSNIPVVDQTDTLSDEQRQILADKIATERQATGNQIAILMIPTLENEVIESYSLKVAREWGIGSKDKDNGVLLLVVKNDRQLRIETGYGLEGDLTDLRSGRIVRDRITPEFKKDNYFAGINSGLDGIIAAIHSEVDPLISEQSSTTTDLASFPWEAVAFFGLFGISWLGSMLARTKSWWAGGIVGGVAGVIVGLIFGFLFAGIITIICLVIAGLLFDKFVSQNYKEHARRGEAPSWWAGGPYIGGGRSGGGFGGFGGGGFGGGGSSGSW